MSIYAIIYLSKHSLPHSLSIMQYSPLKIRGFKVPKTQQAQPLISESPKLFLWLYFQKPDLFVHYHLRI